MSDRQSDEVFMLTGSLGCIGAWALRNLVADGTRVIATDLPGVIAEIKKRQAAGREQPVPVVIHADKDLKYEAVIKVMDQLQRADVKRVGLAVRVTT